MNQTESLDNRKLVMWTVIAAVIVAIVNSIIYLIMDSEFEGVSVGESEFMVGNVIFLSVVLIVLGGVTLWGINRFSDRPITLWRYVAVAVLLISYLAPVLGLDAPSTTPRIILLILHTIAGAVTIYLLSTRTKAEI
jgi:hypothetical protein